MICSPEICRQGNHSTPYHSTKSCKQLLISLNATIIIYNYYFMMIYLNLSTRSQNRSTEKISRAASSLSIWCSYFVKWNCPQNGRDGYGRVIASFAEWRFSPGDAEGSWGRAVIRFVLACTPTTSCWEIISHIAPLMQGKERTTLRGWELNSLTPLPTSWCTGSGSKWHHQLQRQFS